MSTKDDGGPDAEPVAWISHCVATGRDMYGALPIQSLQPGAYKHTPLYSSPPKRKPLPVERVNQIINASRESDEGPTALVRRTERAHGIGDE